MGEWFTNLWTTLLLWNAMLWVWFNPLSTTMKIVVGVGAAVGVYFLSSMLPALFLAGALVFVALSYFNRIQ